MAKAGLPRRVSSTNPARLPRAPTSTNSRRPSACMASIVSRNATVWVHCATASSRIASGSLGHPPARRTRIDRDARDDGSSSDRRTRRSGRRPGGSSAYGRRAKTGVPRTEYSRWRRRSSDARELGGRHGQDDLVRAVVHRDVDTVRRPASRQSASTRSLMGRHGDQAGRGQVARRLETAHDRARAGRACARAPDRSGRHRRRTGPGSRRCYARAPRRAAGPAGSTPGKAPIAR